MRTRATITNMASKYLSNEVTQILASLNLYPLLQLEHTPVPWLQSSQFSSSHKIQLFISVVLAESKDVKWPGWHYKHTSVSSKQSPHPIILQGSQVSELISLLPHPGTHSKHLVLQTLQWLQPSWHSSPLAA